MMKMELSCDIPNKVKTTSVSGTKTWKGDNEKDRPSINQSRLTTK